MSATPVPDPLETAVVGRRVGQFIIDWLIIAVVNGLLLSLFLFSPTESDGAVDSSSPGFWLILVVVIVGSILWPLYVWVFRPLRNDGQTFGMSMLGLQVVAIDGTAASGGKLFVRMLLLAVDVGITPLVGLLTMLITNRNQRVGDLVASTIVRRVG